MPFRSLRSRPRAAALCLLAGLLLPDPAPAQQDPGSAPREDTGTSGGVLFGLTTGLGSGGMRVGGQGASASGLLLGGQLALESAGVRTWVLEVTANTFDVPNPLMDESYRAVSFLVRRSFGSTVSVAPGIGFDHRAWSGPQRVEDSDVGVTVGVNVGAALPLSDRLRLLPEASFQTSGIELEGSVSALLLSIRVTLLVSPG